jgi:hypothetical protein
VWQKGPAIRIIIRQRRPFLVTPEDIIASSFSAVPAFANFQGGGPEIFRLGPPPPKSPLLFINLGKPGMYTGSKSFIMDDTFTNSVSACPMDPMAENNSPPAAFSNRRLWINPQKRHAPFYHFIDATPHPLMRFRMRCRVL